ncbi:MAG: hypothetical protein E6469_12650 [Clostridium perfringens]|uniref:hypothetical protein n=1 Tax=Clostridium perfringens TaxID=1502 RepID=UPI0024BCD3DF|nr:hypothetical protein [Clostridium perfringens]EGT0683769.1 hypothetical protein [Clostridium perfringens]EGT0686799.1 hypothetical protein [Clostridium perfringens]EIF2806968.1 hypothetical protein [Clostridium perfringens]ELC8309348.1 hypothetical protein [Clostridium perfringens]ELC8392263.1 hypothetical protein [Clostridium perfringens]
MKTERLSFLLRKENFLEESKKALTMKEVDLIKDITGVARITNNTSMDLLLTLKDHTLGEINPDFTEMISLVIAKVQNILSLPEILEVKAEILQLSEKIEKAINKHKDMEEIPKKFILKTETNKIALKVLEDKLKFIVNSYMPLTEDELVLISNILGINVSREYIKDYLPNLKEIKFECWLDNSFSDRLNLIIAKINNM